MLSTYTFPKDIGDPRYSPQEENFETLIHIPTPIQIITDIAIQEEKQTDLDKKKINAYLAHPKHLEALMTEDSLSFDTYNESPDWDSLINTCKTTIAIRNEINIKHLPARLLHLHYILQQRTYTFLLNFLYAEFHEIKNPGEISSEILEISQAALENRKHIKENYLSQNDKIILANFYQVILLPLYPDYKTIDINDEQTQKHLTEINEYTDLMEKYSKFSEIQIEKWIVASYKSIPARIALNEYGKLFYSVKNLLNELKELDATIISPEVIGDLIDCLLEKDYTDFLENELEMLECLDQSLKIVEATPDLQNYHEKLVAYYNQLSDTPYIYTENNNLTIENEAQYNEEENTYSESSFSMVSEELDSVPEDIDDSRYLALHENYRNLIVGLPTPIKLITPYKTLKNDNLDTYLTNPDHLCAMLVENKINEYTYHSNPDWQEMINSCLHSIELRKTINTQDLTALTLHIHHILLQRTYILLLNFQYAQSRETKEENNISVTMHAALSNLSLIKENDLSDKGKILFVFQHGIALTIDYTFLEKFRLEENNESVTIYLKKINRRSDLLINMFETYPHADSHLLWRIACYKVILVRISLQKTKELLYSLKMLFLDVLNLIKDDWSLNAINKLLNIFLEINPSDLNDQDYIEWRTCVIFAIKLTDEIPGFEDHYNSLVTYYNRIADSPFVPTHNMSVKQTHEEEKQNTAFVISTLQTNKIETRPILAELESPKNNSPYNKQVQAFNSTIFRSKAAENNSKSETSSINRANLENVAPQR